MDKKVIVLFLLNLIVCRAIRQSLNGQWILGGNSSEKNVICNATVPGGVYFDLMDSGYIGDIFWKTGDTDYRWVGQNDWIYDRKFTIDEDLLSHRVVNLIFEGLDTFAAIIVNGVEVGTTENMFVRYVFEIKKYLQIGSNEISVKFTSAVNKAAAIAHDPKNKYVIYPECPPDNYNGICYANRVRKMQSSFAWDWGPAFASVGIWKDVYLQAFNDAVIDYVVATPLRRDQFWNLRIFVYLDSGGAQSVPGNFSFQLSLGDEKQSIEFHETVIMEDSELVLVSNWTMNKTDMELWWPNGYGNQTLYNLTVKFISDNNETDEKSLRIGFRTVELVQESLSDGLTFYFKVNNHSIFAKGSNEIPLSILPEKGQNPNLIRNILKSAKDVNMNMLRVWGGGVYESDYFYDLADEFGILIWQDFMFACALYPADDAFLNNVVAEVRHQVKRLGSHPSIALWAGNNENEAALVQSWYSPKQDFEIYKKDYIKLYVDVIRTELLKILPDANYMTSSPSNGQETNEEGYVANNPYNPLYGDVHFYDYKSNSWSPTTFPVTRFVSEYGYQSMPSVESWLTATDNIDNVKPESGFLYYRQHHPDGTQENLNLIGNQLNLPDSLNANYTQAFIYFSQIIQAQSIKMETEFYRSFKGRVGVNGLGYTMGALYWQLNDVWVAPTWSSIDFTGRWKMLHYHTKDFFNPTLVTGVVNDDYLEVYAIFDGLDIELDAKAVIYVYNWQSLEPLLAVDFPTTLNEEKAVLVTKIHVFTALVVAGCGSDFQTSIKNCFFHLRLIDGNDNDLSPFNYVFLEKLKDCNLANATVKISSVVAKNTEFEIVLTTDAVALFVWLDSHDIKGGFSENGFLQVELSKTIIFEPEDTVSLEDFKKSLTVTHLRDSVFL